MKVRCRTNLDDYKHETWPEEFSCRPMVGDKVKAKSSKSLYIVTITHTMYDPMEYTNHTNLIPMLIIELHKRGAV